MSALLARANSSRGANACDRVPGGTVHGLKGERTLMRIHIGERDRYKGKALYLAIIELLRERQYAGATVLRGIAGFGASARIRTDRVEILSLDLPIIVECVETAENVEAILPELDEMIGGGLITLERAKVIMYRPETAPRTRVTELDITGSWDTYSPPDREDG
jgi:PII-like signaling protein